MASPRVTGLGREAEGLVVWALATFHTATFVLGLILLLYARNVLGEVLRGLNTAVGLGLFLALWATTYFTTARALRGIRLGASGEAGDHLIPRAVRWGARNGVFFLAVLGLVLLGNALAAGPLDLAAMGRTATLVVFVSPFALIVAYGLGAILGLVFGTLDLALIGLAQRIAAGR